MKAARVNEYGHSNSIQVTDVNRPALKEGQVLVRVCASSVNPVDTILREGRMARDSAVQPPFTLGWDLAGQVADVGEGTVDFAIGENVYGQASVLDGGSGAFAEYATTSHDLLGAMPHNLSYAEAASLPLVGTSAVEAILDHIHLQTGQKILIHGGSGGIGSVAIQIAKYIGAYVISTSTGQGIEFAMSLGADQCIDYKHQAFDEVVSDCDCLLDTIGEDTYFRSFRVVKRGGIIVSMLEQPDQESMRRYGVNSIFLRTSVTTEALEVLRDLVESRIVKPHVDRTYSLDQIQQAFQAKEQGQIQGKIAVSVAE